MSGHTDILLRNLGFHGNPFSSLEAGKEEGREWFYASFVEPSGFSTILGDATSPEPLIVFAPRGSGKTALRSMLNYYCRRGYVPGGKVLSIAHVDPSAIEEKAARLEPRALARLHVETIIQKGLAALCQQVLDEPKLQGELPRRLDPGERELLRWYIASYGQDLRPADASLAYALAADVVTAAHSTPPTRAKVHQPGEARDGRGWSYVVLLRRFVDLLLNPRPFAACYVLVDGIDELGSTAADWDQAAAMVEPLAANLKLMDLPGVAFRFFLPAELKPRLLSREAVRRDRIIFHDLVWTSQGLTDLLHKRLLAFSEYHIESLDQISEDALRGGRLEAEMVEACQATPRTLLRLGQELIRQQAALLQQEPEHADWLLREEAWRRTKEALVPPASKPLLQATLAPPAGASQSGLLQRVMQDYPGPIAVTCRDYVLQRDPFHKLNRLLDVFEITIAFCAVLMMAQYQWQVETYGRQQSKSLAQVLGESCKRMSLGNWRWVLSRLTGLSGSLGRTSIGSHLHQFVAGDTADAVQSLLQLRNQLAHSALRSDPGFYVRQLTDAEAQLNQVLAALDFLGDLQLVRVTKLQRQGNSYLHEARLYRGDNPNFPYTDLTLFRALDSGRMYVIYNTTQLAIHPLLIAERCPECGQEEVFLYQGVNSDDVLYHCLGTGHSLTSTACRTELKTLFGI